jgi:DNA-binding IclR family transcriptional regulator
MIDDLSVLETKIITALAASPAPIGLISLMVAAATSYSSASVTTRVLISKGLVERRHLRGGYIYRLSPAAFEAVQSKGVL